MSSCWTSRTVKRPQRRSYRVLIPSLLVIGKASGCSAKLALLMLSRGPPSRGAFFPLGPRKRQGGWADSRCWNHDLTRHQPLPWRTKVVLGGRGLVCSIAVRLCLSSFHTSARKTMMNRLPHVTGQGVGDSGAQPQRSFLRSRRSMCDISRPLVLAQSLAYFVSLSVRICLGNRRVIHG